MRRLLVLGLLVWSVSNLFAWVCPSCGDNVDAYYTCPYGANGIYYQHGKSGYNCPLAVICKWCGHQVLFAAKDFGSTDFSHFKGCPDGGCCDVSTCPVHKTVICQHNTTHHSATDVCENEISHSFCESSDSALKAKIDTLSALMTTACVECGAIRYCKVCNAHVCVPVKCPERGDCITHLCTVCGECYCSATGEKHIKTGHMLPDCKVCGKKMCYNNKHIHDEDDPSCPDRDDCTLKVCEHCLETICTATGSKHVGHYGDCSTCGKAGVICPRVKSSHLVKCASCDVYFCPDDKHLNTTCSTCNKKYCPTADYASHFMSCTYAKCKGKIFCKESSTHFRKCTLCNRMTCEGEIPVVHDVPCHECNTTYCKVAGHKCPNGADVPPDGTETTPPEEDPLDKNCKNDSANCCFITCGEFATPKSSGKLCGIVYCKTHIKNHTHLVIATDVPKNCPNGKECSPSKCQTCGGQLCIGGSGHYPKVHDHSVSNDPPDDSPELNPDDPVYDPASLPSGSDSISLICDKLLPKFDLIPETETFWVLYVPLDLSGAPFFVGDLSFEISTDWESVSILSSFCRGISIFVFALIFCFGIIKALRQW